jgi:hypothetical protein
MVHNGERIGGVNMGKAETVEEFLSRGGEVEKLPDAVSMEQYASNNSRRQSGHWVKVKQLAMLQVIKKPRKRGGKSL